MGASALKTAAASTKRKEIPSSSSSKEGKKKKSALEEIIEVEHYLSVSAQNNLFKLNVLLAFQMEERKRQQQEPVRTDYWLQPNIIVKVITKKVGDRYYKKKAVVVVRILDSLLIRGNMCR